MYDLLPRYQAVADHSAASSAATLYPKDLPAPWLDRARAGEVFAMHEFLRQSWSDPGWVGKPHLEPRLGYGHGTLQRCTWDGRRITVTTEAQTDPRLGGWDDLAGDGTVPSSCAMPIEMSNNLPTGFLEQQRHGPLAALPTVSAWVRKSLGYESLEAMRGEQRPVVLGVGLEQVLQPRVPSLIVAEVRGIQDSVADAIVRAEIVPYDNPNRPPMFTDLELDLSTETFGGVLPGLQPGLYDVTIFAEEVPGAGDLRSWPLSAGDQAISRRAWGAAVGRFDRRLMGELVAYVDEEVTVVDAELESGIGLAIEASDQGIESGDTVEIPVVAEGM